MRLALLGADDEALQLVQSAVAGGAHELVAAYDAGPRAAEVTAIAPAAVVSEDWESLVLGTHAQAVIVARGLAGLASQTGISDEERRADQLRKLAQAAIPLLVICPACESIVGFEIEMIRRDSRGVILPLIPGQHHPSVVELAKSLWAGEGLPVGHIEQIVIEREQGDRGRPAVLAQLARDAAIVRRLVGAIRSVTATGQAPKAGRDPLGPKPEELPALANLSVALGGEIEAPARWSVGPVAAREGAKITLVGERGRAALDLPLADCWQHEIAAALDRFEQLVAGGEAATAAWLDACRDQEVAEAVDRSLSRGRTIELYNEQHTEEDSFKGVMAMGGCLLLVGALGVLFVATIVEGLRLPLRDWAVWRYWPVYLLVPIAVFLLLQVLQLIVKKETPDLRPFVGGRPNAD
jgi:hypothetical protein